MVNLNDLLSETAAPDSEAPISDADASDSDSDDDEDWDEDEDESEPGEGGIFDGVAGSADPADTLLFNIFQKAVKSGQKMSSKPRAPRARTRRRRYSGKKSK